MNIEDIIKNKVASLQDRPTDEDTLLRSIAEHNDNLPEVNTPDSLRLPSVELNPKDAYEALVRFKAECAARHDNCVMCHLPIAIRKDSIGREVLGSTYCGEKCAHLGRSLICDLKQAAGLGYGGEVPSV